MLQHIYSLAHKTNNQFVSLLSVPSMFKNKATVYRKFFITDENEIILADVNVSFCKWNHLGKNGAHDRCWGVVSFPKKCNGRSKV